MKVVILAGGFGTRLAEETHSIPKPMVEIGGKPIVWHLMNIYARAGFKEFVLALGYKGEVIKDYFLNYHSLNEDLTVDLGSGKTLSHSFGQNSSNSLDWIVHLIDTGPRTMTGGRLKRLKDFVGNETFMVTYADGLADIDINTLLDFHRSHGKLGTVTTVPPPSRFGDLVIKDKKVLSFNEKPLERKGLINGGFFVFEPGIFEYIAGDDISLEREPLEKLVQDEQLMSYEHTGFWQMMDTILEKKLLEDLWATGDAPWRSR